MILVIIIIIKLIIRKKKHFVNNNNNIDHYIIIIFYNLHKRTRKQHMNVHKKNLKRIISRIIITKLTKLISKR